MRSFFLTGLVCVGMPLCATAQGTVQQTVQRFAEISAKVATPLGPQFRVIVAKMLQARHPELARKLTPAVEKSSPAVREEPAVSPAEAVVYRQFGRFGDVSTDADRGRLIVDLALQVRALPPGAGKLDLARNLCGAVSEGDMGPEAITAVAQTMAASMRGAPSDATMYLELANLIHYGRVRPPMEDAALDAALELLEVRKALVQEARFSLTGLDSRVYSLASLRGKVVLVNFWATSCMPCRKEMPDIEKVYREFGHKGLVVLAISTEERTVVANFAASQGYSFPILLDPGGKASASFYVDGIPESFIFDRQGRLIADSIDRRTESQFRSMLKAAGLE